jgi:DNA-binding transcriptional LysR family regulator
MKAARCITSSTRHRVGKRPASEVRIQVRGFEAMCRMVETNVGIGIVPHSAALRHKQTMQLSLIELSDPWSVRERSMVVQSLDALPLYARDLVEFIRQQTAQVPPVPVEKEAA